MHKSGHKKFPLGVSSLSKNRVLLGGLILFILLALTITAVVAQSSNDFTFESSLSDDPAAKTGTWKEVTVAVENATNSGITGVTVYFYVYSNYDTPLDGSEGEFLAEVWDSQNSTWVPAAPVFEDETYTVEIAQDVDFNPNEVKDFKFRVKFAEGKSTLYNVEFFAEQTEEVLGQSEPYDLAVMDAYEPDNTASQAHLLTLGAVFKSCSFVPKGYDDSDWFKFTVNSTNCVYVIETFSIANLDDVDTYLYLYDDPSEEPIAEDDDSGNNLYSKIYYYFSQPGTYYVEVKPYDEYEDGYYGIQVTTMPATMVIKGYVYDYDGGTDFSAYAILRNLNGSKAVMAPVFEGYYEINAPLGRYKLEYSPHPESGLIPEWYENKKSLQNADVISPLDGVFDEESGKFVVQLEDTILASEDDAPIVEIFSPAEDEVITDWSFDGSFKVTEDSIRSVDVELYDMNGDLVDAYHYGYEFQTGTTHTVNFEVTSDCLYTLEITAEDESGNMVSESVSFYVDTEAPTINFSGFTDGSFYTTTVTPVVQFVDEHLVSTSAVLYKDDEVVEGWVSGKSVSEEGDYMLYAEAEDIAGNITTKSATFVIDRTAPEIQFTGFENGSYYNTTVTPDVICVDKHLDYCEAILYKDDVQIEDWEAGDPVTEEGTYEIYVEAADKAGNISEATATFVIDKTAPTVELTEPEGGMAYEGTITVDATYTGGVVAVRVLVDEEEVATSVPYVLDTTLFSDGEHTITVCVSDRAGNTASDSVCVIFDNLAPVINITPADGSCISAEEVVPEIEVYDATLKNVLMFLDGESYVEGTTVTGEGSHEIVVAAVDEFGRSSLARSRFVLDATPPEISISGVEDGEIYSSPVTITFEATDELCGIESLTATLNDEEISSGTTVDSDGVYKLIVTARDKAGNTSTKEVNFETSIAATSERYFGTDRYATAVQISRNHFDTSEYVVIATGENFPDALSAAPLAKALNAPILLVRKGSVPQIVLDEIHRLQATKAIIIGGTGAVSDTVKETLEEHELTVERIGGKNRYETSKLIAEKLAEVLGKETFDKAYIATGENFPDALSAAPLAAFEGVPVLLVKKDSVPVEIEEVIEEYSISSTIIIGGTGAISSSVESSLPNPTRLAGPNRYATSVEIAEYALGTLHFDDEVIYIATGENYPDALASAAAACRVPAAVLLVPSNLPLKPETEEFLSGNKQINEVRVIGGPGAVSDSVVARVLDLLE